MTEAFVAVVVTVPEEHFPDEDDICLTAGNFVCAKLESHLVQHGHLIPDWIQGGCDEDWGVYLESKLNDTTFQYHICFFPGPLGTTQSQMLIQYNARLPFMKRLFRKPAELFPERPIHETMRSFGNLFNSSQMLTEFQFERGSEKKSIAKRSTGAADHGGVALSTEIPLSNEGWRVPLTVALERQCGGTVAGAWKRGSRPVSDSSRASQSPRQWYTPEVGESRSPHSATLVPRVCASHK